MIPASLTRQSALPDNKAAFDITHGIVTATDRRVTGGYVAQGASHASLYATAEVWLKDDAGREHHFRGNAVDNAREGHRLIVVTKRKNGSLLRVRNLSARTTFDSGDLAPIQLGPGSFIWGTIGMAGLLAIPALFIFIAWLAIATSLHVGPYMYGAIESGWHFRRFVALLLGFCAWLMIRMNTHRQTTAKTLAAQIDAAFAKHGCLPS